MAAASGAFIGHLCPAGLKFWGGKGVATFLGVVIALDWRAALGFAVVWLAIAYATRYSSLAALVASFATFGLLLLLGQSSLAALVFFLACVLWWKHGENILRLRAGTEGKIGQKG